MIKSLTSLIDKTRVMLHKGLPLGDTFELKGKVKFTLRKADGTVESWSTNAVVNVGKEHVAQLLAGEAPTLMNYMELGTGTTPVDPTDTQLETPVVPNTRKLCTSVTRNVRDVTFRGDWGVGEAVALLTEAGIFNGPTAGVDMLSHSVFTAKNKETNDSITVEWIISVN